MFINPRPEPIVKIYPTSFNLIPYIFHEHLSRVAIPRKNKNIKPIVTLKYTILNTLSNFFPSWNLALPDFLLSV